VAYAISHVVNVCAMLVITNDDLTQVTIEIIDDLSLKSVIPKLNWDPLSYPLFSVVIKGFCGIKGS